MIMGGLNTCQFVSSVSSHTINNLPNYFYFYGGLQPQLVSQYHCPKIKALYTSSSNFSTSSKTNHTGFILDHNDDDDDIQALLQILPLDLRDRLIEDGKLAHLVEVILDLGRPPQVCYFGDSGKRKLRDTEVSAKELEYAQNAIGEFGADNRAGIATTLHRISAIKSRKGEIIGLTCRVGRAVQGQIGMVRDLLDYGESILFLGRPGIGKTTVVREIARVLSEELHKRVVIVDTSNEIGGCGDIPHPAIGTARLLQVAEPSMQHHVMVEAVENHMPEVIIVDEIGTDAEVHACRTISERGVMLIGTAHGQQIENVIKNPTLRHLIGGLESVTLSDEEARRRKTRKTNLERKGPATFPFLVEVRERHSWVIHRTERSVDAILRGKKPLVEEERRAFPCSNRKMESSGVKQQT